MEQSQLHIRQVWPRGQQQQRAATPGGSAMYLLSKGLAFAVFSLQPTGYLLNDTSFLSFISFKCS